MENHWNLSHETDCESCDEGNIIKREIKEEMFVIKIDGSLSKMH